MVSIPTKALKYNVVNIGTEEIGVVPNPERMESDTPNAIIKTPAINTSVRTARFSFSLSIILSKYKIYNYCVNSLITVWYNLSAQLQITLIPSCCKSHFFDR